MVSGRCIQHRGAVLRHYFSDDELGSISQRINTEIPSGLDYYPLLTAGERFPISDPHLQPCLTPHPNDPVRFLHGLLESMAHIEALGYQKLITLGGGPVHSIYTAGGGAKNLTWKTLRAKALGIPLMPSLHSEAAYGTARLAADLIAKA